MNNLEKYEKVDKLGEGTYGVVDKVLGTHALMEDKQKQRFVAIKKIHFESEEQGIPSTTIRQISILKELSHPNIVKLEDVIQSHMSVNLVFEYVDYDLKKYMMKFNETGLGPMQVKLFSYQLLKGLQHCHKKNILHRDIKPQNLLISGDGILKIADFGLARTSGIPSKGYSHEVVTLWYRPPDVLLGSQNYSFDVDVWSVGCIMAQMVLRRPIFLGKKEEDQLDRIFEMVGSPNAENWANVKELPQWKDEKFKKNNENNLKKILKNISNQGIDLIQRMLQLNPKARISTSDALKHKYFNDISHEKLPNYK